MRPGTDGIERLSKMQTAMEARSISVIIATAKRQEYDRIRVLDLGAEDPIVKPFSMTETVSSVKAVLRRSHPRQKSKLLKVGSLWSPHKEPHFVERKVGFLYIAQFH